MKNQPLGFFDRLFINKQDKQQKYGLGNDLDQIPSLTNLDKKNNVPIHSTTILKDVAYTKCPQLIVKYPFEKYQKQYAETIFLIRTELKFKGFLQSAESWILLKTKEEVQKFNRKSKLDFHHKEQKQTIENLILKLSKPPSNQQAKQHKQYFEFLQQSPQKERWNLKILGQFPIRILHTKGVKNCLNNTICKPCRRHDKYFLTLTSQNIIITEQQLIQGYIQQSIVYSHHLTIQYGIEQLHHISKFNARIKSGRSKFKVGFHKLHDLVKFAYTINQLKNKTEYLNPNKRFGSFSPERINNWGKFYNDGESYFSDMYDEIEKAEHKICITGWCITPYLILKRPIQPGADIHTSKYRLDNVLGRAAKRGVKIFIIVFQEPSLFVNNDSLNVFNIFQNLHSNFKVLRHPRILVPQQWSHHQKSSFMGGLDICYGRWDNHRHPINDEGGLWYGADYNNQRQRGITKPRQYDKSNLNRQSQPRMPWHDIALQLKGAAVIDLQRHFVLYWYFTIRDISDDPRDHVTNFYDRYKEIRREKNVIEQQRKMKQQIDKEQDQLAKKKVVTEQQMKVIEYTYFTQKIQRPQQNDFTFKQRYTIANEAFKDLVNQKLNKSCKQVFVQGFSIHTKPGHLKMQLCRSSSTWSTGIQKVQCSIYNAYRSLIQQSEQFIYIENQFFMSFENMISQDLAARIIKAHQQSKKFKLIVMMPLLPGFEGDVTKPSSGVLRIQMQIQFEAISRHKSSLMQIIKDYNIQKHQNIQISDYISFVGLRNHAKFNFTPKTQIIYVHSKLMIVDDKRMIIGSANINDRSLLGSRDSQLAMVIESPQAKFGSGQIFQFRCSIFKQHFDMSQNQCANIHNYWEQFNKYALDNTLVYREVFGCIPDDTVMRFTDVAELQKSAKLFLYDQKIGQLKGNYVQWPIDFLKYEDLSAQIGQKQALMKTIFFT